MNKILLGLALGALASASVAQIPMSKYVRSFNSASATRGYFFQAPVDFTVTHLEVPDETGLGEYIVALYKLTAAPPAYSGTVPVTPTFFAGGVPSDTKVAVTAKAGDFKTGEWVAVLGLAGKNTGTASNSYGAATGANNPSSILGTPIAIGLQRCGIQANIGPTLGVGAMWSEVGGNISRIRMTVKSPNSVTVDGAESCKYCPPSNGTASLNVCDTNPAIIGQELKLEMRSGGTANTGGLMAFGLLRGNIPVPGLGTLCVQGIVDVVAFGAGPIVDLPVGTVLSIGTIPAATPIGVKVVFQGALATAGPTIPLTNGLEVEAGR